MFSPAFSSVSKSAVIVLMRVLSCKRSRLKWNLKKQASLFKSCLHKWKDLIRFRPQKKKRSNRKGMLHVPSAQHPHYFVTTWQSEAMVKVEVSTPMQTLNQLMWWQCVRWVGCGGDTCFTRLLRKNEERRQPTVNHYNVTQGGVLQQRGWVGKQLSSRRAPVLTFSVDLDTENTWQCHSLLFKSTECLSKPLHFPFPHPHDT